MGDWGLAVIFGFMLVTFVLGLSSIIMGFFNPENDAEVIKHRVEYGFFGVSGLVATALFVYILW